MLFRALSGVMAGLCLWSAYLQLNDPDPARWVAMYLAGAVVAVVAAAGKSARWLSASVFAIALAWALAILPELLGRWRPDDLMAKMVPDRPEIEYGREFGGLMIVATYCLAAFAVAWSQARSAPGRK